MGVQLHVEVLTTAVLGNGHVSGVAFQDGRTLACDMVVLAAGIRPNVELARQAGLTVNRGIVVGDDLACVGAPDVYAAGNVPNIEAASMAWSRRCGSRPRCSPTV